MLDTPTIREIPTDRPGACAFHITGCVTSDDFSAMGRRMLDVFDAHEGKVDMLLQFDGFDGAEPLAGLSGPGIESRLKALSRVGRYVVVGAPDSAADMIETLDAVLPVRALAVDDLAEGWRLVGARPA